MNLKNLMGSGDKIMLPVAPFAVAGVALNIWRPEWFSVGGPAPWLRTLSILMLVVGVPIWLWSVALILTRVPKGELITGGPYALVKHPLYTAVALLVIPAAGFLLNTWLGAALGLGMYLLARRYAPEEDRKLASEFGPAYDSYRRHVKLAWL